jgi:hypothetical protein
MQFFLLFQFSVSWSPYKLSNNRLLLIMLMEALLQAFKGGTGNTGNVFLQLTDTYPI